MVDFLPADPIQVQLYQLRTSSEKPPFVVELEVGLSTEISRGMKGLDAGRVMAKD